MRRNPLSKRYLRTLRQDAGKYIALFLFMVILIGFTSGYLVADNSMLYTFYSGFDTYNVEDGHFILRHTPDEALLTFVEEQGVTLYDLSFKDKELEAQGESADEMRENTGFVGGEQRVVLEGDTIRFFRIREEVNLHCIMEGRLPETDAEVVIDRLYAENNNLHVGETLHIEGRTFTITGTVALSDYGTMFKNNSDMMFNASLFSIALVTKEGFDALRNNGLQHCYAYRFQNRPADDTKAKEASDDLAEALDDYIDKRKDMQDDDLLEFVARQDNQAIVFTGEDMEGDMVMMELLLYIVIAVMAFIFAVTTRSDMEKEAGAIGTLRASGYTRTEMLKHYLLLPLLLTILSALIGNLIGYTFMKGLMAQMYYHSYSLPQYVTRWSPEAFLKTTLIPCSIVLLVCFFVLFTTLKLPPLKFLRHDLRTSRSKKVVPIPAGPFVSRFRLRVILQNKASYAVLFFGIFLASLLLMFGNLFTPLLLRFKSVILDSMICSHQYVLKEAQETLDPDAEKYCMFSLMNGDEEVSVYGIEENSRYFRNIALPEAMNAVVVSSAFRDKYDLQDGERLKLKVKYGTREFDYIVAGTYDYDAGLAVYMKRSLFNRGFFQEMEYYTGYFSNRELEDLDPEAVQTVITQADLTTVADQLIDSMGNIMGLFVYFAAAIFVIVIYLLAKLIVERNAQSISMLKILGYTNREVGKIYNTATAVVVVVSLALSLPLSYYVIDILFAYFMQKMTGYLPYYVAPEIFARVFLTGVVCYIFVHLLQMRRVRRIPMGEALKNVE